MERKRAQFSQFCFNHSIPFVGFACSWWVHRWMNWTELAVMVPPNKYKNGVFVLKRCEKGDLFPSLLSFLNCSWSSSSSSLQSKNNSPKFLKESPQVSVKRLEFCQQIRTASHEEIITWRLWFLRQDNLIVFASFLIHN